MKFYFGETPGIAMSEGLALAMLLECRNSSLSDVGQADQSG